MGRKRKIQTIGGAVGVFTTTDRRDLALALATVGEIISRHGDAVEPFDCLVLGKLMAAERIMRDALEDVSDDR